MFRVMVVEVVQIGSATSPRLDTHDLRIGKFRWCRRGKSDIEQADLLRVQNDSGETGIEVGLLDDDFIHDWTIRAEGGGNPLLLRVAFSCLVSMSCAVWKIIKKSSLFIYLKRWLRYRRRFSSTGVEKISTALGEMSQRYTPLFPILFAGFKLVTCVFNLC